MTTYIVAVHLILEVSPTNARAEIGARLDATLTGAMRQNAGAHGTLLDWAVAGDDLADSIAPVSLPAGYQPDESDFPSWPRCQTARAKRTAISRRRSSSALLR